MGYALIWIESLAVCLLLVALTTAWAARWAGRLKQTLIPLAVVFLLALLAGAIFTGMRALFFNGPVTLRTYAYFLSWAVALALGVCGILYEGLRRPAPATAPDSSIRPDGSLGVALRLGFLFLVGVGVVVGDVWTLHVSPGDPRDPEIGILLCWAGVLTLGAAGLLFWVLRRPDRETVARTWPVGRLALALAVVVLLDGFTFWNVDRAIKVQSRTQLAEVHDQIRTLLPPDVPKGENAALLYREAFASLPLTDEVPRRLILPDPWKENAELRLDGRILFDVQDKDLADLLRSKKQVSSLLRQAAARPGCSFGRDYFQPVEGRPKEWDWFFWASELLALDARTKARRGDPGAFDDVTALFAMARHSNEPLLVALVDSSFSEHTAARTLGDILAHLTPRAEDLARLHLADVSYYPKYRQTLQMEDAIGLSQLLATLGTDSGADRAWLQQRIHPPLLWLVDSSFYRVFFLQDDIAAYRRHNQEAQDLATRPYAEAAGEWKRQRATYRPLFHGLVARRLGRDASFWVDFVTEGDAWHRLAQLALAVEAYRINKGRFPNRLEDLAPDYLTTIPTDPFSGKPMRLKHDGKDLVLYSVGLDLKDDDGTPWNGKEQKGDLVFRLRGR